MSTLEALGMAAQDDESCRRALAFPVDRFINEESVPIRVSACLENVARMLGARTLGDLCTRQGDEALERIGGRRALKQVVRVFTQWVDEFEELDVDDDVDLDGRSSDPSDGSVFQESLFRPTDARRASDLPPPPPADGRAGLPALVAWAERLGLADVLDAPVQRALPAVVLPLLRVPAETPLREALARLAGPAPASAPTPASDPPPTRGWFPRGRPVAPPRPAGPSPSVPRIVNDLIQHHLAVVAENRRALDEREAGHPRVTASADTGPLARFRAAVVECLTTLGPGEPRLRGSIFARLDFADDPARLEYVEAPPGRTGITFGPVGGFTVHVPLGAWSTTPLSTRCTCAADSQSCAHRRSALTAVLDLIERPTLPGHQRLSAYLGTPAWQRVLERFERKLAELPVTAPRENERVAWVVRQRAEGSVTLSPVLQRLGPRGWSKGASMYIAELARRSRGAAGGPDGASDGRAIDLVIANVQVWSQSTLSDPAQVFRALEALVGATTVFLDERRDAPASVRRVSPRLLVEELPAGAEYALRFSLGEGPPRDAGGLLEVAPDRRHAIAVDPAANEVRLALLPPEVALLADALDREPATLPADAIESVLARLERVQAVIPFELPPALVGETIAADSRVVCQLTPTGETGLTLEVGLRPLPDAALQSPGEGAAVVFARTETRRLAARRDLDAERRRAHALCASLGLPESARASSPWRFALTDREEALDLVMALREAGPDVVVEWPQDAWRVDTARAQALRLRVTERRDWFGLEGGVEVDGTLVSLAALLEAVRRRRRYVTLGPGRFARIEEALRRRLGAADDSLLVSRGAVELGTAAPELVAALVEDPAHLDSIPSFEELRARRARAARHVPVMPGGLVATLRPYQREGFEWLSRLAEGGAGACLADDMGLGKTIQTLALLLERAPRGPALILAPTSVVPNWLAEAERFAPTLRRRLYRGGERGLLLGDLGAGDVLVTSYAIAARDVEALASVTFATLVIDEAQALKNAQAQRTHAVRRLAADWRLALTGTPIENHLGELWSLFRVVSPALLGGWEHFRERFAIPIERHQDADRRRALADLMRPFLLRRTKQEVAPELPIKTELTRLIDLSPGERRLYDAARAAAVAALTGDKGGGGGGGGDTGAEANARAARSPADGPAGGRPRDSEGKRRFQILAALTRLRLLACHPRLADESFAAPSAKLEALVELVTTLRETGHRALVFSQFVGFLDLAQAALEASGARVVLLHGGTPAAQRANLVTQFQGGAADVFLISLKAGGTGLNLTEADTVIHLDPWWNPAVEDQATDRSHRIGQRRPVTVIRLVARATVEEAVLALHADKRALARSVLDGADGAAPLDAAELLSLLEAGAGAAGWERGEDDAIPEQGASDGASGRVAPRPPGDPPARAREGGSGSDSDRQGEGDEDDDDGAERQEGGAAALDLTSLDALIERAMAPLERGGAPTSTTAQYRRALARFREFVTAGRALHVTSWSEAAALFLAALRDKSWPASPSFFLLAGSSLGHLRRAERPD
jgi:superfamily II DNA or RNA helicase